MNKLNVIISSEYGNELISTIKILTTDKNKFIRNFNKDNSNWISYLQYLIIFNFNDSFLSNYNINFIKYTNFINYKIDLNKFVILSKKYKDFFDVINWINKTQLNELLCKYENFARYKNIEEDYYYFFLHLIMLSSWTNITKTLNEVIIEIKHKQDIKKDEKSIIINKTLIKENIIKYIGYYLEKIWWREIVLVGDDILSKATYNILYDYCLSNQIKIDKIQDFSKYNFIFNNKIFILPENLYDKKFKTFFSFPWYIIILI